MNTYELIIIITNTYKLYEKTGNYPFYIAHMPDLFGSIPTYIFYD